MCMSIIDYVVAGHMEVLDQAKSPVIVDLWAMLQAETVKFS